MSITPAITVSSLDYERLAALLETCEQGHPVAGRLEAELERAEVVEPEAMPANVITMNSRARIRLGDGQEKLLTLVYPREADSEQGRISVLAPIGAALLGLSIGQDMQWPTPSGTTRLTVLEIVYQPEAAGEYHR
ncbi:nucleoside diphosphate kinase regulator [Chromobacterium subtsugae]|uniref:Nucleoside diphosphate kinase regulator n=1 Tax=Chromobacterium subtsugae TaxID=251747 RepID=A0ABS7FD47_9NEIS|nr:MULTISPECIES: nucleoside diphosphate kinase regulator [Chromobacterium]KUM05121.1 transcription elongation factor GreAB [Chromobacterium subtsugae]KZE88152.1 transcription elongation factor GreAB [Chromobacterium sp. F49]MBW7565675.1 nucleoside diphosphate kinase regulator [Chromobacterium subtsugae]MBW8288006.1 nucleoside diphosphate kinase regulator [Chromobacterium subtsugae]OBU86858.1 elongation factor GreAB [Chromobacterium subtsugae]